MNRKCKKCGHGNNIVDDPVKGFSYCSCGTMVSESFIQNDVGFNAGGAMIGTVMPKDNGGY